MENVETSMFNTTWVGLAMILVVSWIVIQAIEERMYMRKGYKVAQGPWRLPFYGNAHQMAWHYYSRLEYIMQLTKQVSAIQSRNA